MLTVQALGFAYRRGEEIISDLSHDFPGRAITAITGPSGSGKSTLLYLLALMLRPTSGTVTYFGRPVSGLADGERSRLRASTVGFVFQDAMLDLSRSVQSNVAEGGLYAGMSRGARSRSSAELLDHFGVAHRMSHRPGEVSGGQAQRVAMSRALIKKPAMILSDEPTGNLDSASAEVVWTALKAAADEGSTVVVATHDVSLADRADVHLKLRA